MSTCIPRGEFSLRSLPLPVRSEEEIETDPIPRLLPPYFGNAMLLAMEEDAAPMAEEDIFGSHPHLPGGPQGEGELSTGMAVHWAGVLSVAVVADKDLKGDHCLPLGDRGASYF